MVQLNQGPYCTLDDFASYPALVSVKCGAERRIPPS